MTYLPQIGGRHALMLEVPPRTIQNGQILRGMRVTVLEAAIGEPGKVDLPPAPDGLQRIRRGPPLLVETVEGEGTLSAWGESRLLLNAKVLGGLLELHRGASGRSAVGGMAAAVDVRAKKEIERIELETVAHSVSNPVFLSISSVMDGVSPTQFQC